MKKNVFSLLSAMSMMLALTGCAGGSQVQNATDEDSVAAVEETVAEEPVVPADSVNMEFNGLVVDEMMSTVTIFTEDSDTVTYVKGNEFTSDAAIGDNVAVTLDNENGEEEIVSIRKL